MAKREQEKEEVQPDVTVEVPDPERSGRATTAPTGKRPRVMGRLAKPVYLIHHGKFEVTIPAETREIVVTDPDAENFGDIVEETVVEEYAVKGELPKGSRYGSRRVGVAHEVWDAAEAERLREKGFVEASEAEVKKSSEIGGSKRGGMTTDEIAMQERERALRNYRTMTGERAAREDEGERG